MTPPPSRPGQQRAALPPAEPLLQQRAMAALFVAMLSLVGPMGLNNGQRGVYIMLFALLAGAVGVWLGATAMVRARRSAAAAPRGALVATIVGGLGIVISALALATFAVLGKQLSSYEQCMSVANTISDDHACYAHFIHQVNLLQGLGRR